MSLTPVKEALARVVGGVSSLTAEQCALADGLGRVLAADVASRLTQPPVAVSSMDGYAVRARDVASCPATLRLIGESAAGRPFAGSIGEGEAARIFTGAPLPQGADAVVMQENTEAEGESVTVKEAVGEGNFVRPAGMDFKEGDVLLPRGRLLSARDIALAAAMNVPWLMVVRKPRIAILATGDELVMPGEPLAPGQIISSNSLGVAAMVKALGGEAINLGIARDDEDSLHRLAAGVAGADMLVTIGGASVGDYDLVRTVLGKDGLNLDFYKIAMKPGKPLIFGHIGATPMLGLPGNPVSAVVTALIFLRAAMEGMAGTYREDAYLSSAVLGTDVGKNGPRQEYMRASLARTAQGEMVAKPYPEQDSAMLARLAQADCLVIRPPHAVPAKAGERVDIIDLRHGTVSV